jgi:hypothetical protein
MQSNQNLIDKSFVINNSIWDTLIHHITTLSNSEIITEIDNISNKYNIEIKNLFKDFLNYMIRYKSRYITKEFLDFSEFIMHIHDVNIDYLKSYSIIRLKSLL